MSRKSKRHSIKGQTCLAWRNRAAGETGPRVFPNHRERRNGARCKGGSAASMDTLVVTNALPVPSIGTACTAWLRS